MLQKVYCPVFMNHMYLAEIQKVNSNKKEGMQNIVRYNVVITSLGRIRGTVQLRQDVYKSNQLNFQ